MRLFSSAGADGRVMQSFRGFFLMIMLGAGWAASADEWESGRAGFQITVNGELAIPYRVFSVFAVPREQIRFAAPNIHATSEDGSIRETMRGVWQWTAPEKPGITELEFQSGDDVIRINAFTLIPSNLADDGALQSFRIGYYPAPLEDSPIYSAPDGFIALDDSTAGLQLSPHFSIQQFPSKQSGGYPKFLVLRESLLLKLEMLLERVNERGISASTFTVMSGFRTPAYNQAIGNVQHSRHIYGGAADIYIDEAPHDGVMDDINGDGELNYADAQLLYLIADELFAEDGNALLRGGLGVYRSTATHGPFIHIDARGRPARWGLIP